MTFSDNLKAYRKSRKISQTQLAQELGVSQRTISHYENGTAEPSLTALCRIADLMHSTTDALLGRKAD